METNIQERRRTNFSMTSKGIVSCDVTFESNVKTNEEVVTEAPTATTEIDTGEVNPQEIQDIVNAVRASGVDVSQASKLLSNVMVVGDFGRSLPAKARNTIIGVIDQLEEGPAASGESSVSPFGNIDADIERDLASPGTPPMTSSIDPAKLIVRLADAVDQVNHDLADVLDKYLEDQDYHQDIPSVPEISKIIKEKEELKDF